MSRTRTPTTMPGAARRSPAAIGEHPAPLPAAPKSSRLPSVIQQGEAHLSEVPKPIPVRRQPTALSASPVPERHVREAARVAEEYAVTPPVSPEPAVPKRPRTPSFLPGKVIRQFQVSEQELAQLYPSHSAEVRLGAVREVMTAPGPDALASQWVRFGEDAQTAVSTLLQERLALMQGSDVRLIPVLLGQLNKVLLDVLDCFEGGLFKSSPQKAWANAEPQVKALEQRMRDAIPALQRLLQEWATLEERTRKEYLRLQSLDVACQWLETKLEQEKLHVLVARGAAMLGSQRLAQDQLFQLAQETTVFQEQVLLVQDGVLVKLPAVMAQMASMTARLNDTQRLLLSEVLRDLSSTLTRK